MRSTILYIAMLLVCFVPLAGLAEVRVPELRTRVTDLTQTLNFQEQSALESRLTALESAKGSQVAVLIVPTTQPETIEQYAIRAFEAWKLGRKSVDDGVLLIVAKDDRTLRIEVGYGLEGAIPDATAKRVIDEIIVPEFRAGKFAAGINSGVETLIKLIEGEALPDPPESTVNKLGWFGENGIFVVVMLGAVLGQLLGTAKAAGMMGIAGAGVAYFLVRQVFVSLGIGIFVALVVLGMNQRGGRSVGGRRGYSSGGRGGGFSGGGGRSGGGGASGRW